jgi:hypothetical protein
MDLGAKGVRFATDVGERGTWCGTRIGATYHSAKLGTLIHDVECFSKCQPSSPAECYSIFFPSSRFLLSFYVVTFRFLSFDHKYFDLIRRLWRGRYLLFRSQF